VTVVTGSTAFGMPITRTVTRDVGGIYDDSSINYILAGHACKKLGVPLWFAVTGARLYNRIHNKNWRIGDVCWLKKGYKEYGLRDDW